MSTETLLSCACYHLLSRVCTHAHVCELLFLSPLSLHSPLSSLISPLSLSGTLLLRSALHSCWKISLHGTAASTFLFPNTNFSHLSPAPELPLLLPPLTPPFRRALSHPEWNYWETEHYFGCFPSLPSTDSKRWDFAFRRCCGCMLLL